MFIVGVGASAGGLDALDRLFSGVPPELEVAWLVVQHLAADHKSSTAALLGARTRLVVEEAHDGAPLREGCVLVLPPGSNMVVEGAVVRLVERASEGLNLPVDALFCSLAEVPGGQVVGVVLSGMGSDGRLGVEAIRAVGGFVIAQDAESARFDAMPQAASATGACDVICAPELVWGHVAAFKERSSSLRAPSPPTQSALASLLAALQRDSGVDFSEYKPATVHRRIERRMQLLGLDRLEEYVRRVEGDAAERGALGRDMLINVTQFFRDPEVFEAIERLVMPELVRREEQPLRIWVAGCSTGQEVYSLAILLAEASLDFKIFATDVDQAALDVASAGRYVAEEIGGMSQARCERFFALREGRWEVSRELRRRIVFAHHNIVRDPPFTRLDLLSCRNVLIYLSAPAQARALSSFAFALKPGGALVIGASESLGGYADRFEAYDARLKLFQRVTPARPARPEIAPLMAPTPATQADATGTQQATDAALRLLMARVAPAAVLVNEAQQVVAVFGNVANLLSLSMGLASLSLVALLPRGLGVIASLAIHRARATQAEVVMGAGGGEGGVTQVRVIPFVVGRAATRYEVVAFELETSAAAREPLDEETLRRLSDMEQELLAVRRDTQARVEALETANEELQATNEELLASNEELQSTNEDLQSVNEELHTLAADHKAQIGSYARANVELGNILRAMIVATLFLDSGLKILRFTPAIGEVFALTEGDVGRPLATFAGALKVEGLLEDARGVLASGVRAERVEEAADGRRFLVRSAPYVCDEVLSGVVISMVEVTMLAS